MISYYLKRERSFKVVDLANEAIGRIIKSNANPTIIKNEKLWQSIKKKQIKVKTAQYMTAKKDAQP